MECWEGSWAASCLWCCECKWTLQGTPRVSKKIQHTMSQQCYLSLASSLSASLTLSSLVSGKCLMYYVVRLLHSQYVGFKKQTKKQLLDIWRALCLMPFSVWSSRVAALAYLSVEFDSKNVVGVTVVADFCPLLEMVDVHALWHRGAHHNYQTAGEKTLYDVNIRSFCWGQRAGDQYHVSSPTSLIQTVLQFTHFIHTAKKWHIKC